MSFNELNSVERTIIQKLTYLRIACYGGQGGEDSNTEARAVEKAKFEQKMIGGIEG